MSNPLLECVDIACHYPATRTMMGAPAEGLVRIVQEWE